MRVFTRDFRFRGKRSREMEDNIEIVIVECLDLVDQIPLGVLGCNGFDAVRQWCQVRGDDAIATLFCQPLNKSLTNFTACACDEHKFFGHRFSLHATSAAFFTSDLSDTYPSSGTIKS